MKKQIDHLELTSLKFESKYDDRLLKPYISPSTTPTPTITHPTIFSLYPVSSQKSPNAGLIYCCVQLLSTSIGQCN